MIYGTWRTSMSNELCYKVTLDFVRLYAMKSGLYLDCLLIKILYWVWFRVYECFLLLEMNHYVGRRIETKDLECLFSGLNEILDQNFDWIIGYMIMKYFSVDLYFINGLFQEENMSKGICGNS